MKNFSAIHPVVRRPFQKKTHGEGVYHHPPPSAPAEARVNTVTEEAEHFFFQIRITDADRGHIGEDGNDQLLAVSYSEVLKSRLRKCLTLHCLNMRVPSYFLAVTSPWELPAY